MNPKLDFLDSPSSPGLRGAASGGFLAQQFDFLDFPSSLGLRGAASGVFSGSEI